MIYLTGQEYVPVGFNRYGRLLDLNRIEVLCAANEAARENQREMAAALYRWQHRLLLRERASHPLGDDGGRAA